MIESIYYMSVSINRVYLLRNSIYTFIIKGAIEVYCRCRATWARKPRKKRNSKYRSRKL